VLSDPTEQRREIPSTVRNLSDSCNQLVTLSRLSGGLLRHTTRDAEVSVDRVTTRDLA
jgi:hypothetical protein